MGLLKRAQLQQLCLPGKSSSTFERAMRILQKKHIKQRLNPRTGKPYAGSYVNKIRAVLRAALCQAQRWEYMPIRRNVAALARPATTG